MSFEQIDALYRSRLTLLKLLASAGYNTVPFERFSPREIDMMTIAKGSLDFVAESEGEQKRYARVIYASAKFTKPKMDEFVNSLELTDEEVAASEFIVMLTDPIVDAHHASSLHYWVTRHIKVRYFNINQLTYNPLDSEYNARYEIIPANKHADLLKSLYCTSKSQLPKIVYHLDHSGRCLGLVVGDIIKVYRNSANVGEATSYRVCAP
jgi:DNA-directed RNA polymerase subunit H (RpoH/RPB5)